MSYGAPPNYIDLAILLSNLEKGCILTLQKIAKY